MSTELTTFVKEVANAYAKISGVTNPESWLIDAMNGGAHSPAGPVVTAASAMSIPGVYASVRRIAGDIASTPLEIRRPLPGGGSELVPGHNVAELINVEVRDEVMGGYAFKEAIASQALLHGNGTAAIVRDGFGAVKKLVLLPASNTHGRMWQGGKYHVTYLDPHYYSELDVYRTAVSEGGYTYMIPDAEVFHLPNVSANGLWGISFVGIMRDILGLDIAGRDASGSAYRNNGRPGMLLHAPDGAFMTHKEGDEYITEWNKKNAGRNNANKTALLRGGITAEVLPVSEADAAFLESRKFSRDDVLLAFGTNHILGEAAAVYKDLASRLAAYLQLTLTPWFERFTLEVERKLLAPGEQGRLVARMNAERLLKADPNTLADYTGKLRQQAVINGNEAREMHNLNPGDDPALLEYENPNTSSAAGEVIDAAQQRDDDDQAERDRQADNRARIAAKVADQAERVDKAARMVFAGHIENEIRQVKAIARRSGNFLQGVDTFYEGFGAVLKLVCVELDIDQAAADEHVTESRRQVVHKAGEVDQAGLEQAVAELTNDWTDRAKGFTHVRFRSE